MTASALAASLQRIGQIQAHLSGPWSVSLAILAIGAAFLPWLWPVTRHITTMAHEGAHATVGSAIGRQVEGMTFQANGFGATTLAGKGVLGNLSTGIVGYLGPSAFGVGAAEMIRIHGKRADDAKELQNLTRIPRAFWSGLWLAGSVVALVFGGIQLL